MLFTFTEAPDGARVQDRSLRPSFLDRARDLRFLAALADRPRDPDLHVPQRTAGSMELRLARALVQHAAAATGRPGRRSQSRLGRQLRRRLGTVGQVGLWR